MNLCDKYSISYFTKNVNTFFNFYLTSIGIVICRKASIKMIYFVNNFRCNKRRLFFMKNFCIIFLSLIIISLTAVGFSGVLSNGGEKVAIGGEYLRIHIRADSNEAQAQAVKYKVRDAVVEYLTPLVAECKTKGEAMVAMGNALKEIAAVANEVLEEEGFFYGASAALKQEQFPTRIYGEYILPAGEYSALILRLGRGEGDNWWCVVYPPLCFVGDGNANVIYKSKIKEIINKFYR